jgi:hypothetical protein
MTPVELLIKSMLDSKGFQDAEKFLDKMGDSIKQGFGINVGEKILEWIEKVPELLKEGIAEGMHFNAVIEDSQQIFDTLLGNIGAAHARVQELVEFSEAHPIFSFSDVEAADRYLQVVTKGALATEHGLTLIGDAAAASHISMTQMAEVVGRLYGNLNEGMPVEHSTRQLYNMGLISAETARHLNEVAERGEGIGKAMELIDQTLGKTAGAMVRRTETLNGQMAELAKNSEDLWAAATAGATRHFEELLKQINHVMESPSVKLFFEIAPKILAATGRLSTPGGLLSGSHSPARPAISPADYGGAVGGAAADAGGPMPLTEKQIQFQKDLQKALTETMRDGMTEREKIVDEYFEALRDADDMFANNEKAHQEAIEAIDKEFNARFVADRAKRDDAAEKNTLDQRNRDAAALREEHQRELQAAEDQLQLSQQLYQLNVASLDLDFRRPDYEKREERIKLIREEIEATQKLIDKMKAAMDLESDPAAKQALKQQIIGKEGELNSQAIDLAKLQSADPQSLFDQWEKARTDLLEGWTTTAQQIGDAFKTNINSAIQSTSHELTNAIVLTGDFDTALKNIGATILEDIVSAVIQMGLRWIATQILTHSIGESLKGESAITTAAAGVAAMIAWAPAAMAASIATEGEADIEGEIAFDAAMAGALAGFRSGDYTGDGDPSEVAGFAHKGEFYFSAPATRAIGVPTLRAMHSAALSGNVVGAMGGGGAGGEQKAARPVNVHFAVLRDPNEIRSFLESTDGKKIIGDIATQTILKMQN